MEYPSWFALTCLETLTLPCLPCFGLQYFDLVCRKHICGVRVQIPFYSTAKWQYSIIKGISWSRKLELGLFLFLVEDDTISSCKLFRIRMKEDKKYIIAATKSKLPQNDCQNHTAGGWVSDGRKGPSICPLRAIPKGRGCKPLQWLPGDAIHAWIRPSTIFNIYQGSIPNSEKGSNNSIPNPIPATAYSTDINRWAMAISTMQ